jgi:hypothetical protein
MHRTFVSICLCLMVMGCVAEATGPAFNTQGPAPVPIGYTRVYVFRDKVLYLAQAPYVVRAQIEIDGRPIGALLNGSYLSVNLSRGPHSLIAQSGEYYTTRTFTVENGSVGYIEISDMTRMEGGRMLAAGALAALVARGNAVGSGETIAQIRQDMIAGAAGAVSQDESFAGPQRVWDIEFPSSDDATPKLTQLALAN